MTAWSCLGINASLAAKASHSLASCDISIILKLYTRRKSSRHAWSGWKASNSSKHLTKLGRQAITSLTYSRFLGNRMVRSWQKYSHIQRHSHNVNKVVSCSRSLKSRRRTALWMEIWRWFSKGQTSPSIAVHYSELCLTRPLFKEGTISRPVRWN